LWYEKDEVYRISGEFMKVSPRFESRSNVSRTRILSVTYVALVLPPKNQDIEYHVRGLLHAGRYDVQAVYVKTLLCHIPI
jgi:hypothetical protein